MITRNFILKIFSLRILTLFANNAISGQGVTLKGTLKNYDTKSVVLVTSSSEEIVIKRKDISSTQFEYLKDKTGQEVEVIVSIKSIKD